jgi:hypothetical protein
MKDVRLSRPAFINDLLRYPTENPIAVSDDDAERLRASGCLEEDGDEDGLDELKAADLDKIIADEGVSVSATANKADKVAAIRAHRAPAE